MILVTGGSGFLGNAVLKKLAENYRSKELITTIRNSKVQLPNGVRSIRVENIASSTDWSNSLKGVDTIIHCAARVHITQPRIKNCLDPYLQVNTFGTLNLAHQAERAKVRRFIFVSSIKVNGELSLSGYPLTPDDKPVPVDPYGISKLEAEKGLIKLSKTTKMEIVIIRPPLIYGKGVKANFESMIYWLSLGVPLPFGKINNLRSFVGLDNLVDLLITCIDHPLAIGKTFMVSDDDDISTTELLRRTANAMGKKVILLPVPVYYLESLGALFGISDKIQKLCGNLQLDINKTKKLLNWKPPITLDEGLFKTVEDIKR